MKTETLQLFTVFSVELDSLGPERKIGGKRIWERSRVTMLLKKRNDD